MGRRCKSFDIDDSKVDYSRPHTHQEIADILGLTKMRVCQIEKEAIEKIKKTPNGKQLLDFLYE
jgi:DNA-directed RNA polymerase sigma subunit (sigma70/sigma32)